MAYANVMIHFDLGDTIQLVIGTDDVGRMKRMVPFCKPTSGSEELSTAAVELLGHDGSVRVVVLKVECVFVREQVERVVLPGNELLPISYYHRPPGYQDNGGDRGDRGEGTPTD